MNLRDRIPGLALLTERWLGLCAKRKLPRWRTEYFTKDHSNAALPPFAKGGLEAAPATPPNGSAVSTTGASPEVVLLADTFNNYYEPDNLHAAVEVLRAAGYCVIVIRPEADERPLCCGRTFLAAGLVDEARAEARRLIEALMPYARRGVPIVGLEPSCLFTLRDELLSLFPRDEVEGLSSQALLFEEFLAREHAAGRLHLALAQRPGQRALLHGHCHQKAFGAMSAVESTLRLIPGLEVETVTSSCCGMAGSFGYEAEHFDASMRMAEASLLPKVRDAGHATTIVADGTSCRHQIHDGTRREAVHVARVLRDALVRRT
jgi:Fe-S oxidoreductase